MTGNIPPLRVVAEALAAIGNQWKHVSDWELQAVCPTGCGGTLTGRAVFNGAAVACSNGCQLAAILTPLNLRPEQLYNSPQPVKGGGFTVSTHYRFPYGVKTRIDAYRADGTRERKRVTWQDKQDGVTPVFWCAVTEQHAGADVSAAALADAKRVWVCEGEKTAAALQRFTATAGALRDVAVSFGGTGEAGAVDVAPLADKHVVLCPDGDKPGRDAITTLANRLTGVAAVVEIVETPEGYGDFADYWAAGKPWQPDPVPWDSEFFIEPLEVIEGVGNPAIAPKPLNWIWEGFFPAGELSLLVAPPGTGKTTLTIELMAQATRGKLEGDFKGTPITCAALLLEDNVWKITHAKAVLAGVVPERFKLINGTKTVKSKNGEVKRLPVSFPAFVPELRKLMQQTGARFIVIDPLTRAVPMDSNNREEVYAALSPLQDLAQELDAGIIVIGHTNKGARNLQDSVAGSTALQGVARSVVQLQKIPDDPGGVLVSINKGNYSDNEKKQAFHIGTQPVTHEGGEIKEVPFVTGFETTDLSPEELYARSRAGYNPEHKSTAEAAAEDIYAYVEGLGEPVTAGELKAYAKDEGHGSSAIANALQILQDGKKYNPPLERKRVGGKNGRFYYRLPDWEWPQPC